MELRKESVQMLQIKSRAASQVTFDTDYNVPDAKPDVGRLIQNKGDVSMDEVRLSEGKAFISGNLNVDILYVGEENQKVSSLGAKLPFDETLNLEGIASGDKMCLKWEIEDLSVHMIHSRKLNIKAIVTFYAVVDEMAGIQLPVEISEEGISVKRKKVRLMSLSDTRSARFTACIAKSRAYSAVRIFSSVPESTFPNIGSLFFKFMFSASSTFPTAASTWS